jgi:hypothetical protein
MPTTRVSALVLLLTSALVLAALSPAAAQTVTDCGDTTPDGVPGQLRFLLNNAVDGTVIVIPPECPVITLTGTADDDSGESGDLDVQDEVTIRGQGPGVTVIDANGVDRAFHVLPGASLTLERLTVRNGDATQNSLVFPLTGGGIYNQDGVLTLRDVAVVDSKATEGGGIVNASGTLVLTDVTISGNTATAGRGGGVRSVHLAATLTNVTVSGNAATGDGGGISTDAPMTLQNVTVANNQADSDGALGGAGGGIAVLSMNGPILNLRNTIVAGNTVGVSGTAPDCSGTLFSLGNNLLASTAGCTFTAAAGDLVGNPDAYLGPLTDNGGGLRTHALQPLSAAIDAGSATGCPATDARGFARPADGDVDGLPACDIGAFEAHVSGVSLALALNQGSYRAGDFLSVGVTVANAAGPDTPIDVYLIFVAPPAASVALGCTPASGPAAAFIVNGGLNLDVVCLGATPPASFAAFAADLVIPAGLPPVTAPDVFVATIPTGMPAGTWQVHLAFTADHALEDSLVQLPADVVAGASVTFEALP